MDEPFTTVKEFFSALSDKASANIRAHLTGDFLLLEHGEVWDASRLIDAVQGDYRRRNFFALIESEHEADQAWLAYWNRALIDDSESGAREYNWLETAALERRDGRWLLRMLHSTRTEASSLPAGVRLDEYPLTRPAG